MSNIGQELTTSTMAATTIAKQSEDLFAKLLTLHNIQLNDNELQNFAQQHMVGSHHLVLMLLIFRREIKVP